MPTISTVIQPISEQVRLCLNFENTLIVVQLGASVYAVQHFRFGLGVVWGFGACSRIFLIPAGADERQVRFYWFLGSQPRSIAVLEKGGGGRPVTPYLTPPARPWRVITNPRLIHPFRIWKSRHSADTQVWMCCTQHEHLKRIQPNRLVYMTRKHLKRLRIA